MRALPSPPTPAPARPVAWPQAPPRPTKAPRADSTPGRPERQEAPVRRPEAARPRRARSRRGFPTPVRQAWPRVEAAQAGRPTKERERSKASPTRAYPRSGRRPERPRLAGFPRLGRPVRRQEVRTAPEAPAGRMRLARPTRVPALRGRPTLDLRREAARRPPATRAVPNRLPRAGWRPWARWCRAASVSAGPRSRPHPRSGWPVRPGAREARTSCSGGAFGSSGTGSRRKWPRPQE